jgi:hypothetical protein
MYWLLVRNLWCISVKVQLYTTSLSSSKSVGEGVERLSRMRAFIVFGAHNSYIDPIIRYFCVKNEKGRNKERGIEKLMRKDLKYLL